MSQPAVELEGLTKRFRDMTAVDRLSFRIESGQIFGFMGHNGAGKTTTIQMLLGLLRPTDGQARVLGHDIVTESLAIRAQCGYLPASYRLPREMTPQSFLEYIAAMFELEPELARTRISGLLERFELGPVAHKKLGAFSTGMAQKVGMAQALLNQPRLLLLDEPTSGLDPLGRHELLNYLRSLAHEQGTTILFSTHILSDIESICEQVAILHAGKLLASGPLTALKTAHGCERMDDLYLKLVHAVSTRTSFFPAPSCCRRNIAAF